MFRYSIRATTHAGYVRPVNTDSWWADSSAGLATVADGLASSVEGAQASQRAVAVVRKARGFAHGEQTGAEWEELFELAHARVSQDPGAAASLMVWASSSSGVASIAHVGDARGYLLRDGKLEQLTRDHTQAGVLIESGVLPPGAARFHASRLALLAALGTTSHLPEITRFQMEHGDRVVLVTDGITDAADERVIPGAIMAPDASIRLMVAALASGGPDALTSVVIDATIA